MRVKDLPCFPEHPLVEQIDLDDAARHELTEHDLESFWCEWPDAEQVVLRRGTDFDDVVFAIPPGMARHVCGELIADRPEWRAMVEGIGTVATQALQIWLRSDEPSLGWDAPGSTMSGYVEPFDTWASMPQLIAAEDWPSDDAPGTIAYFCNTLATPEAADRGDPTQPARAHADVRGHAAKFLRDDLAHLLPGAVDAEGFRWQELCGGGTAEGPDRLDSQYWRANIDPSDRYVQSLPGTDRLRLRAGWQRLREPVPRRRLDRQRPQRRLHRRRGAVGAPGRERVDGPPPRGPHARRVPAGTSLMASAAQLNGRPSSSMALPRTSLWITSAGRWPINLFAVSFECGQVESECG